MRDRPDESASEHYRRLAQECLTMVATIHHDGGASRSDRYGASGCA